MQWILPQTTAATVGYTSWSASEPALYNLLLQNFVAYWAWYAGGMVESDPTPVTRIRRPTRAPRPT